LSRSVFLAGAGHTAHVFDDFAQKLTAHAFLARLPIMATPG
jgi:hypothetical protein